MKRLLSIIILGLIGHVQLKAQGIIVEDTVVLQLGYNEIDSIIVLNGLPSGFLPINYAVAVHRVVYETPNYDGSTTTASGLIMIPEIDTICSMPMMAYLHGTKVKKVQTFYYLRDEWQLGVIAATSGYAMVMPDYIGLGNSPGIHLYQHAQTEASASIDILRVCRSICQQENKHLNGQLFIMGYSQGGHAVLATHRMIQEELNGEFTVTASAPGSGPYDMSGSQLDMVASFDPYAVPGYLPFLIQSYQHIYGNLYDSIQQIYVPPYDQILEPLLQGDHDMWEVNQVMPAVPRDIIQPDYADAFFSDNTHPAYLALKDNDVYEWIPEAPMLYNYCRSDEEVTYLNTVVASQYMSGGGAPDIEVVERDTALGHFECAQPSIFLSKLWFDGMAEFCEGNVGVGEIDVTDDIKPYPNPVSGDFVQFGNDEPISVRVMDIRGKELVPESNVNTNGRLNIKDIPPSVVLVEIRVRDSVGYKRLVIQ
ncbi:MAG: T9SS type A sorting domain-containing protein [Flavobacteriales bacterium]|nr:T9SS type A sorting domain-containing protein [Flavobacteriales bacterium]